jgi:hypothetical protein
LIDDLLTAKNKNKTGSKNNARPFRATHFLEETLATPVDFIVIVFGTAIGRSNLLTKQVFQRKLWNCD